MQQTLLKTPKDFVGILNDHELVNLVRLALREPMDVAVMGTMWDAEHILVSLHVVDTQEGLSRRINLHPMLAISDLSGTIVVAGASLLVPEDLLPDVQEGVMSAMLLHTLTEPIEMRRKGDSITVQAAFGNHVLGATVSARTLEMFFDFVEE